MTDTLITSQHYLDDAVVAAKTAARDYDVMVSPAFAVDDVTYRVVLDGNHSLAAAVAADVEPEITEASTSEHDAVSMLINGDVDGFLTAVHMGEGDYIDAVTRRAIW